MPEHKALKISIEFHEVTQAMLEAFMREMRTINAIGPSSVGQSDEEFYGAVTRAALKCGWIKIPALAATTVDGMSPVHVAWYGRRIAELWHDLRTIPPE